MQKKNINALSQDAIANIQQQFMTKVYGWMTGGLLLTAAVAYLAYDMNLAQSMGGYIWLLFIAQLVLVFALTGAINKMSPAIAAGTFLLYSGLTGLVFSVILMAYSIDSVYNAFLITAGSFAGLSFYGYTTDRDLSPMRSFLVMGLIGVILASIVNIFFMSGWLYFLINVAGVIVFAGLTAYDTQKLKKIAIDTEGNEAAASKSAIVGALALYLDFINLFIFILRFVGGSRD